MEERDAGSRLCERFPPPACQPWGVLTGRYTGFSESIVGFGSVVIAPVPVCTVSEDAITQFYGFGETVPQFE
jgi:hypothetical protein